MRTQQPSNERPGPEWIRTTHGGVYSDARRKRTPTVIYQHEDPKGLWTAYLVYDDSADLPCWSVSVQRHKPPYGAMHQDEADLGDLLAWLDTATADYEHSLL